MHPEIHPTIAIKSHPEHQAAGGYFVSAKQREKQGARHRVCRMAADKTIHSARVTTDDMEHTRKRRFVGRTRTADPMFDKPRRDIIGSAYCGGKADKDQQTSKKRLATMR